MELEVDVASAEAVYEQIVRQVHQAILAGTLAAGAALPSIRQCADDLDLNPNTVAKAYKILENNRIIRTAGRKGTFVDADAVALVKLMHQRLADYAVKQTIVELRAKGLSLNQIEDAFHAAFAAQRTRASA